MQKRAGVAATQVASKTAAYTLADATDFCILADASGGAFTLTLPAASGIKGRWFLLAKTDSSANAVTIDPNAAETIDGKATLDLVQQREAVLVQSDGANWVLLAHVPSGLAWKEVTGTSQTMSPDTGYIANNAALVTLTLPSSAPIGTRLRVAGKGAGGWRVAQGTGQKVVFTDGAVAGTDETTTGAGGRIDSTDDFDAVELLCATANTTWVAVQVKGTPTIT